MEEALRYYIRRLTNLTGRSASLRLLRTSVGRFVDVDAMDLALGRPSFAIIEALLAGSSHIPLVPSVDLGDAESNDLSLGLRKLQRNEKFLYQEKGSRDLYLGWPFVEGQLNDGHLIRAPLLLFPVQLRIEKKEWQLHTDKSSPPSFNPVLLLAYFLRNQLPFSPETVSEFTLSLPSEPLSFLVSLHRQIEDSALDLSFNSAQFEQRLRPFRSYKKAELESSTKTGCLRLFPQAVLGLFSQSSSTLISDYTHLLAMEPPPQPEDMLPSRRSSAAARLSCAPLPMDGSQEAAFTRIKDGDSLVIQGPPGTGKSQLITNLICNAIAGNKKVLLVCQKRAALDVVRTRLSEMGLSNYIMQVCDVRNDRKALYSQLYSHIDSLSQLQPDWNEGPLQKRFMLLEETIENGSKKWESLRSALYDSSDCGLSVKNLYLSADPRAPSLFDRGACLRFSASDLPALERKLRQLARYKLRFAAPQPWAARLSFSKYSAAADLPQIQAIVKQSKVVLADFAAKGSCYFITPPTLGQLRSVFLEEKALQQLAESLKAAPSLVCQEWLRPLLTSESLRAAEALLARAKVQLGELFDEAPPPACGLAPEVAALLRSRMPFLLRLRVRPLRWLLYRWFRKEYKLVAEACAALSVAEKVEGLQIMEQALEKRAKLEQLHEQLASREWAHQLPEALSDATKWQKWLDTQKQRLDLQSNYLSTSLHRLGFRAEVHNFYDQLKELQQWLAELSAFSEVANTYLSFEQQVRLSEDTTYADQLLQSLFTDFEDICRFDSLEESLTEAESSLLSSLHKQTASWDADRLWSLCLNSWQLAWIEQIERKYPVLREVCTDAFAEEAAELQQMQSDKEALSAKWLQLHLQQRAAAPYFDRPKRRGPSAYSKLRYQLGKRRQIWPIRQLLAEFSEEMFLLSPCWLASPDAVSALFPMEKCFDLVLFDEASQCFVENGLPSLYRAKQAVVVGDKAQLQPSDLYLGRWEEDDTVPKDELLPKDNISFLDWAATSLAQMTLQSHYRSQSPDLIDFSNQHFYQGKLSLIPTYDVLQNYRPAIRYLKVDGYWENNTNPLEAQKVIELLQRLFKEQPHKEIGVVTFNYPQQELLLQEIDTHLSSSPTDAAVWERLFVKNIENVQGDERDIIIFSIGYAPHQEGAQLKHFFGTLNLEGGENRLNVAVTRAREALYVVSSIWPKELKVEQLSSQGPKLLKAYLQYALEVSEGRYQAVALSDQVPSNTLRLRDKLLNMAPSGRVRVRQLPFADLSYHRSEEIASLLYTDDDLYYGAPSAKAFHLHRARLLAAKGWPYMDFYSRAYWLDPNKLQQQLQAIEENSHKQQP